MMSLLQSHLEQISLSATAIADLPYETCPSPTLIGHMDKAANWFVHCRFPPPKMFVNALLGPHDITTLIRDTEAHERALFSTNPASHMKHSHRRATRRGTMFPTETERETMASRIYSAKSRRNQYAVARVLGGDMMEAIRRSANAPSSRSKPGEVNIEVLLRGAEMLCDV